MTKPLSIVGRPAGRDTQYEVVLTIAAPWPPEAHNELTNDMVAAAIRHHLTEAKVRVLQISARRPHLRITSEAS